MMPDVDKVLILVYRFDPIQVKCTLVLITAPGESSVSTRPLRFCSTCSLPPPFPPLIPNFSVGGKGKAYILGTSSHVGY